MNTQALVRAITKTGVILVFWCVFLLSLMLRDNLSFQVILFDLTKSFIVAAMAWVFLLILNDTVLKSMIEGAKDARVDRYNGGLSYHLAEPSKEERAWQRKYEKSLREKKSTSKPS